MFGLSPGVGAAITHNREVVKLRPIGALPRGDCCWETPGGHDTPASEASAVTRINGCESYEHPVPEGGKKLP